MVPDGNGKVEAAGSGKKDEVSVTVDGRPLNVNGRKQSAASVLQLAGLDPAGYNLAQLRPGGAPPKRFDDGDQINLKDGDAFVSVRERADVA